MQIHTAQPNPLISYAITAIVLAVVMAIRWKRMSRPRPLKIERLWIFPAFYACITVAMYVATPPRGLAWLFCAGALGLGAALGWQRGKLMRIMIDPETHAINQTSSPAALLFIMVLVVVRTGARSAMSGLGDNALHLNALAVTDMLIALALGLFTATRLEMYLRATRMLADARAGRPAAS